MFETLWAMTKLFFFFGILPTGILLIVSLPIIKLRRQQMEKNNE